MISPVALIAAHEDRRLTISDRIVYGALWYALDTTEPRPAKLTWLAHRTRIKRNKVSAHLWRLVRCGYVVPCGREPGPSNKARRLFRLTQCPLVPDEGTQMSA